MKWLHSMSATRTAAWSIAGSMTVLLAILIASLRQSRRESPWFWIALLVGYTVMGVMERSFRKGARSGRWSDAEVEKARVFLGWRTWYAIVLFYFAFWAAHFFLTPVTSIFTIGLPAFTNSLRLQAAVRPKNAGGVRVDWNSAAPIHSEHWGMPRIQPTGEMKHGE